ncbi:YcaO-like family protein [Streptomyces sp. NBC_00198]|uniref:YcaO-like family protein n=1 Tax=Streptomyces sp. NBC_00198 TaxID=2975677 RepID=UPI00224F25E8|nr:YcaO-like family protein [Streptomyces sp. NBC_00198]MCX5285948.1 YcaO-like family protein [Streptomyces sp. NBC_00198]MCX5286257.1 YcaO-like family protein [Streptomyces sp. NBC_00198]
MADGLMVLDGTVRSRGPEETWALLEPWLERCGISRVADLTGLDTLGVPVWTAIRPGALTLTASQGKGATPRLAAISAVMESIELWHAEQPLQVDKVAPARALELPYPLLSLPVREPHSGLVDVPLEWTTGVGLVSGRRIPVPVGLVQRFLPTMWRPSVFRATSTGLACGNTPEEAVLHGVYEVMERHALHLDEQMGGELRTVVDPDSVEAPYAAELIERVRAAGVVLELLVVESPYGLPVCLAYLWSEDYPLWFAGSGCHHDPHIALTRAITEAAQSRLTCIAGTRDDLPSEEETFAAEQALPAAVGGPSGARWETLFADVDRTSGGALRGRAEGAVRLVEAVTGYEPILVTLSEPRAAFTAVKVLAPGATSRTRRAIPR